jgi:LytS/YehU family sensor histidine kinase
VADDGLGLDAPLRRTAHGKGSGKGGAGVALANLRERLQARYGDGARLTLEAAHPGTVATLTLPLEPLSV